MRTRGFDREFMPKRRNTSIRGNVNVPQAELWTCLASENGNDAKTNFVRVHLINRHLKKIEEKNCIGAASEIALRESRSKETYNLMDNPNRQLKSREAWNLNLDSFGSA